jgi:hypothetical protein
MLSTLQLIKDQLKEAHDTFNGTVGDVTEDQLHKDPGGKALPLGALYAHLVYSEDAILNGMILGKAPLYTNEFKGKTGSSEDMPAMDEKWSEENERWAKSVKIDLPKLVEYKEVVFKATEQYLNTLTDEDLDKEIDLGAWGKKSLANLLSGFIIAHTNSLTGEISILKGIQGAKGYPF